MKNCELDLKWKLLAFVFGGRNFSNIRRENEGFMTYQIF